MGMCSHLGGCSAILRDGCAEMLPDIDCGVMDFQTDYLLQEELAAGIAVGSEPETMLLLEHPSVYTIGAGDNRANLLDPENTLLRTNRGDITWHGPGQLVG